MKFVFFWGCQAPRGGGVGPGCLSQWWPTSFTVDGVDYPSSEHYMMAEKARLFGDETAAAHVLRSDHPGEAKALGARVTGFDEGVWEAHRFDIVVRGNMAKFGQNKELREYLLGTGKRVLVEASPLDRIWGIGLSADADGAEEPSRWRGLNLLGFALMQVRAALTH